MKKIFLLFLVLIALNTYGQNEFAAAAFYTDFKNIYADAQNNFSLNKGDKRKAEFEELATEYKAKLMLPLADSGKVVVPVSGNPYAIYFFEPDKVRLKVDQRGTNLRDAIITAFGKPLYARTETVLINNHPLTSSYYFIDANETRSAKAAFRMSIYYVEGSYYLSLEIRGNPQQDSR